MITSKIINTNSVTKNIMIKVYGSWFLRDRQIGLQTCENSSILLKKWAFSNKKKRKLSLTNDHFYSKTLADVENCFLAILDMKTWQNKDFWWKNDCFWCSKINNIGVLITEIVNFRPKIGFSVHYCHQNY